MDEHVHGQGDAPHPPAPAEPRKIIPEWPLLWRGLAFLGLSVGTVALAVASLQKGGWLASPVSGLLGLVSGLSAWAAAIHLTGGEKFDDHPFV